MSAWPNWVDLVVVTIIWRACYNGYARGLLTEIVNLVGALCIVALTVNYSKTVANWASGAGALDPRFAAAAVFWGLFLSLWFGVHLLRKHLTDLLKWERFHWLLQVAALCAGGLRGFWWSGFLLLALSSSGFVFVQEGAGNSVLGPRVQQVFHVNLVRVADRFPGARLRGGVEIPPVKGALIPP